MKPIQFKQVNRILKPIQRDDYPLNVREVFDLPVFCDGKQCISKWKLNFKERFKVLFNGILWIDLLSGNTQPPVAIYFDKEIFSKQDN